MEKLLIINNENKTVSTTILDFLERQYQTATATNHEETMSMIKDQFYDLFLVITTEIDAHLIDILNEIRIDHGELLPVIINLPTIDNDSQAKAFKQRIFYLTESPIILEQLKKGLISITKTLSATNDKIITLSTRKYDQDYNVKKIIYFERSRLRYIKIVYEEQGKIVAEEIFFRNSLENFINKYGLNRHFVQMHQSYLVNPRFIKKIDKSDLEVILTTGETLPLGGTYYKKK